MTEQCDKSSVNRPETIREIRYEITWCATPLYSPAAEPARPPWIIEKSLEWPTLTATKDEVKPIFVFCCVLQGDDVLLCAGKTTGSVELTNLMPPDLPQVVIYDRRVPHPFLDGNPFTGIEVLTAYDRRLSAGPLAAIEIPGV